MLSPDFRRRAHERPAFDDSHYGIREEAAKL